MKLGLIVLLFCIYTHAQTKYQVLPLTESEVHIQKLDHSSTGDEEIPDPFKFKPLEEIDIGVELEQQFSKIKSTCEKDKTLKQKIANIREGVDNLSALIDKYLPQRHKLSIKHSIILSEVDNVLSSGMVFRGTLEEQVQNENIRYLFVSYYRFMHNMEHTIEPTDFPLQWAKDVAQGLSCLYSE